MSGDYKFRGYGDDVFSVHLSEAVYGSTASLVNSAPIAFSNAAQGVAVYANYYQNDYPSA